MRVKLTVNVRMPNYNIYVNKGEILDVLEIRGEYYICEYKICEYKGYVIMVFKDKLEVVEK